MAVIERFGGYLRNALDAAGDLIADGVKLIQHAHEAVIHDIAGIILDHAYLLPDYALLLIDGLLRKVGRRNELEQHAQVFLKARGAVEKVRGHAA